MKLEDILESLTFKLPIKWITQTDHQAGIFEIDQEKYDIRVDYHNLSLPTRKEPLAVYEISFRRITATGPSVMQTKSDYPTKVFGVVYNATIELVNEDKPDIIVFSAKFQNDRGDETTFQKRVKIYSSLARRAAAHGVYNEVDAPIDSKHARNFVLIHGSVDITSEEIIWIKNNV